MCTTSLAIAGSTHTPERGVCDQNKVTLTNADIAAGNIERVAERMNEQGGGLAKHSTEFEEGINWKGSRTTERERTDEYRGRC